MGFGHDERLYHPVTYRVEVVEGGEVIGEWRTLAPLVPFSAGDLLNPLGLPFKRWSGLQAAVEAGELFEVVRVEHLVMTMHTELLDSIQLHCRRVPDTYATRGRAGGVSPAATGVSPGRQGTSGSHCDPRKESSYE